MVTAAIKEFEEMIDYLYLWYPYQNKFTDTTELGLHSGTLSILKEDLGEKQKRLEQMFEAGRTKNAKMVQCVWKPMNNVFTEWSPKHSFVLCYFIWTLAVVFAVKPIKLKFLKKEYQCATNGNIHWNDSSIFINPNFGVYRFF